MVVLCGSQGEAQAALERLRQWMAEAGLTLHPDKTRAVDMATEGSHFDVSKGDIKSERMSRDFIIAERYSSTTRLAREFNSQLGHK